MRWLRWCCVSFDKTIRAYPCRSDTIRDAALGRLTRIRGHIRNNREFDICLQPSVNVRPSPEYFLMYFFLSGDEQEGLKVRFIDMIYCTVVIFFIYLRAVNHFHITRPLNCRVQLSSINGLHNAVAFSVLYTVPGGLSVDTPSRAIFLTVDVIDLNIVYASSLLLLDPHIHFPLVLKYLQAQPIRCLK